jgi:hypothetical protein
LNYKQQFQQDLLVHIVGDLQEQNHRRIYLIRLDQQVNDRAINKNHKLPFFSGVFRTSSFVSGFAL